MGAIAITRKVLQSQVVRELVGDRTIDIFGSLTTPERTTKAGSIISRIAGLGSRLLGFAVSLVGRVVRWTLKNLWDIILEFAFELVTFDWNQTDREIENQISSNTQQIFAALGDLAGTSTVWLASVALAGGLTLKFPVLAGKVALALAEEGGEEIRGSLISFLYSARNALARNLILSGLLSARRLELFGLKSITDDREPWTIAGAVEEKIEKIENKNLRAFVENFVESGGEALIEVGYVVTYAIDDYYESQKMAQENALGEQRAVKIYPDSRTEEFITLTGPQQLIKSDIQTTLAQHRFVHNRDLGMLVGQPAEDWLRAKMQRRKLSVVFKSKKQPPWSSLDKRVREFTYTIPDAKVGLTWKEIKSAAKPYTWGKFRATANLDNGRQMAVYGATEKEAEQQLRSLMRLTTAEILTLSVTEEKDRNPALRKEATQLYPAYAVLLIRRSTAERTGRTDLSGQRYNEERQRIELWPDTEPAGLLPLG